MNDYTPTTEDVLEDYAIGRNEEVGAGWYDQHRAEFSRWLAAHDAEKRAEWERAAAEKAWDRCVGEMPLDLDWKNFYGDNNPYRSAAPEPQGEPGSVLPVPDTTKNESEDE